jgi:ATP-dependent protease ClpP protease subunit
VSDEVMDPELVDLKKRAIALEIRRSELDIAVAERNQARVLADNERNGRFSLIGTVNELTVHVLIAKIDHYIGQFPDGEVELLINSGGGSVIDGLALVDYLRHISKNGHKVRIICYGMVASMAGIIMQAADERIMMPRCWLGMHEVSSMAAGTLTIQEDSIKFTKALQAQCMELICERSDLTNTQLKRMWERKDVYLSAEEALKHGLIDHIEEVR